MITSTGAFKTVQTHELFTQEQLSRTLQLASSAWSGGMRAVCGTAASSADLSGPTR